MSIRLCSLNLGNIGLKNALLYLLSFKLPSPLSPLLVFLCYGWQVEALSILISMGKRVELIPMTKKCNLLLFLVCAPVVQSMQGPDFCS